MRSGPFRGYAQRLLDINVGIRAQRLLENNVGIRKARVRHGKTEGQQDRQQTRTTAIGGAS